MIYNDHEVLFGSRSDLMYTREPTFTGAFVPNGPLWALQFIINLYRFMIFDWSLFFFINSDRKTGPVGEIFPMMINHISLIASYIACEMFDRGVPSGNSRRKSLFSSTMALSATRFLLVLWILPNAREIWWRSTSLRGYKPGAYC